MVQFNTKDNEILVKIVYYGTGLSGKTTNLQKLHEMTDPTQKTDLFSVNTMQDRTLFFDLLPLDLGYVYGNSIKLQIYTVPGQVHYDSTRRIVLSGADGVAFVADSDQAKLQENIQSINNLYHNLQANRLNIKEIPLVMQYNKRDLPNVTPVDVLNQKLNFRSVPFFEAVAVTGEGVLETFLATVKQTVRYIFNKYQLSKNIKNVDSVIEKLESSIMSNAKKNEELRNQTVDKKGAGKTVLKYTHEFKEAASPESQEQLLQKAITSNMETAQLYTSLKKSKAALQKKQEELQGLNRQLEKSNADNLKMRRFLESLVNFAGEAIITFNDLWVIQNWNQAAEELFGYKREQILNKNVNVLFPKDAMADLNRVLSYVMNGKVVRGFETTLKTRDGSVIPVNITFSPIKNQNETIIAFTAIVRDLSFMESLSKQLYAVQRFETLGTLYPSLVEQIQARVPNLDPDLGTLLAETREMVLGQSKDPADLNQLVTLARALLEPRLKAHAIAWQAQLFPTLPILKANRVKLMRAIINIYLNAIDSMIGRPRGKVTSGTHASGDEVLLQIIDNGEGMNSDEMDRVFEPLSDEDKNLRGIRLNAAKDLVRAEGGSVRVDSAPGKGTKVTLRFPLA